MEVKNGCISNSSCLSNIAIVHFHDCGRNSKNASFQENYNTPRYRTPNRHSPGNANYKSGIPTYSLLVKIARGVFQRCVETTLEHPIFLLIPFIPCKDESSCDIDVQAAIIFDISLSQEYLLGEHPKLRIQQFGIYLTTFGGISRDLCIQYIMIYS